MEKTAAEAFLREYKEDLKLDIDEIELSQSFSSDTSDEDDFDDNDEEDDFDDNELDSIDDSDFETDEVGGEE